MLQKQTESATKTKRNSPPPNSQAPDLKEKNENHKRKKKNFYQKNYQNSSVAQRGGRSGRPHATEASISSQRLRIMGEIAPRERERERERETPTIREAKKVGREV
jgi:hypothetical protein